MTRFANGAFLFSRARGVEPRAPDVIESLAQSHGFGLDDIPTYAGDRAAFSRAVASARAGLPKEGYLLRPIKRSSSEMVFGIVREEKDVTAATIDHDCEATVSWSAEPDSAVQGDHPIAHRVADAFSHLRGKVVADDWSTCITGYLERHGAARIRSDGRVSWIPPQRLDAVRRYSALLAEVGIDLVLCEIEPEATAVVERVAAESIDEQLTKLQEEADAFDGRQKPSTYARRLDEYQRLRERAVLYRDALGVGVQQAETVLGELETKVSTMLDIRRKTVIHRDDPPSEAPTTEPRPDANATPRLRFAGVDFQPTDTDDPNTLLFVTDDERAISTVHALEAMGLAGTWQKAGPIGVSIENSGPAGSRVSVTLQIPTNTTIQSASRSLAAIGIELI
jgi:hypothetical protein